MIDLTTDDGEVRAIRAILFDMDGTIVDSSEVTARLWNGWAAAHGVSDGFVILHGQPAMDTIRRSFPDADDERLAELAEAQAADECTDLDGVRAMPGAARAARLARLPRHPLGGRDRLGHAHGPGPARSRGDRPHRPRLLRRH